MTLLAIAASHGYANVLGILIRGGAVVDQRGPVGTTAMWEAAAGGKLDAVRVLLEANADVNAPLFFPSTGSSCCPSGLMMTAPRQVLNAVFASTNSETLCLERLWRGLK